MTQYGPRPIQIQIKLYPKKINRVDMSDAKEWAPKASMILNLCIGFLGALQGCFFLLHYFDHGWDVGFQYFLWGLCLL